MSLATTITATLRATLRRQLALSTPEAVLASTFHRSLADGTGASQANGVVALRYTIPASGTQVIDLGAGGQTDYMENALAFTAVKAILVKPSSAAAVQLEPNGSEGFADWVKAAGDGIRIPAGGCFLLAVPEGSGLGVSDNVDDKLLLTNLSGAVEAVVDLVIVGAATVGSVADTTPDPFTFTDATDQALGALVTSNLVTISGITAAAAISITGGEYSINGGSYTSSPGTIANGQNVRVRHTSSASFSTAVNTVLTIGGVSDTFTSTTLAADTTPNAFSFTDQTDVAPGATITSNSITVLGINAPTAISVTGGTYAINGGSYTSSPGTVVVNDTVTVRHTASATYVTATNTVLTIGGVSDTFTSTTRSGLADEGGNPLTDESGTTLDDE